MINEPHVLHGVDGAQRLLVDEAGAATDRRLHWPAERELLRGLGSGPTVVPAVILEADDVALGIDAGSHVGEMGRTVVVPAKLVPPHELHAHRPLHHLRHDGRRERAVIMAGAAEHARAFVVLDPYMIG